MNLNRDITKKIHKYNLEFIDIQSFKMPLGSEVLSVQYQDGADTLSLYCLVDPTGVVFVSRTFAVYGTGHPMFDSPQKYIGTALVERGRLVWHVYEVI